MICSTSLGFAGLRVTLASERWWVYVWSIWGCALGLIVGWSDRSPVEAVLCVAIGSLLACFGMQAWQCIAEGSRRLSLFKFADNTYSSGPTSSWIVNETLALANGRSLFWDVYPAIVPPVALFHGLLLGPPIGALAPVIDDYAITSWQGALLGAVGGPLLCGIVNLIALPIAEWLRPRQPSLNSIEPVFQAAVDEAEGREHLFISHEHLLLALFQHPTGTVLELLHDENISAQRLAAYVRVYMPEQPDYDEAALFPPGSWYDILHTAVEHANKQGLKQVDPGHLLLALIDTWPALTHDMFVRAGGIDGALARERLEQLLSRLNSPK